MEWNINFNIFQSVVDITEHHISSEYPHIVQIYWAVT